MKHRHNALVLLVIMLSLLNVCTALVNYSSNPPVETVKNIEVNFSGEQRWVEVMEGGSGGGGTNGFIKINIIDKGYDDSPHVTISDKDGIFKQFNMSPDEVAKVYVMDKEDGSVLKTITIKDSQDALSYELLQFINSITTDLLDILNQLQITFS
jgi:hypothetical protein